VTDRVRLAVRGRTAWRELAALLKQRCGTGGTGQGRADRDSGRPAGRNVAELEKLGYQSTSGRLRWTVARGRYNLSAGPAGDKGAGCGLVVTLASFRGPIISPSENLASTTLRILRVPRPGLSGCLPSLGRSLVLGTHTCNSSARRITAVPSPSAFRGAGFIHGGTGVAPFPRALRGRPTPEDGFPCSTLR